MRGCRAGARLSAACRQSVAFSCLSSFRRLQTFFYKLFYKQYPLVRYQPGSGQPDVVLEASCHSRATRDQNAGFTPRILGKVSQQGHSLATPFFHILVTTGHKWTGTSGKVNVDV